MQKMPNAATDVLRCLRHQAVEATPGVSVREADCLVAGMRIVLAQAPLEQDVVRNHRHLARPIGSGCETRPGG